MNNLERDINIYLEYISKSMKVRNEEVSNCCCAKVWEDTDICSKCKEHCEIIKI